MRGSLDNILLDVPAIARGLASLIAGTRAIAIKSLMLLLCAVLPLQAITGTLAGVLGTRHAHPDAASHASPMSPTGLADPMAGWKDMRRAQYDYVIGPLPASSDAHAHAAGARHHHEPGVDAVRMEALGDNDGAAGDGATSNLVMSLAAVAGLGLLWPAPKALGSGWRAREPAPYRSAFVRRADRPPQDRG